jgi:D-ribose pyranose/furanose isomerase RbsD
VNKAVLVESVLECNEETREALQMIYDELNNGQQKKLLKNEAVKALFERYGVTI